MRDDVAVRDHVRLADMIGALGGDLTSVITLTIPHDPPSKSRPRFRVVGSGKRRFVQTYSVPEDVADEELTASYLRRSFPDGPWTGNVALAAILYRASRQSIDWDNLAKHVGDAGNGVAWLDDSQITGGAAVVELDASEPRSVLAFAPHRSSMLRGTDAVGECRACGGPRDLDRLFCSTEHAALGRRKGFARRLTRETH